MTAKPRPSSTIPPLEQLEVILDRIYSSRQCFIRIVEYLLAECRSQHEVGQLVSLSAWALQEKQAARVPEVVPDPRSTPKPLKTLSELLAESTGHKRGREITHFAGIPLSVIRSSRPATPPLVRQTSTPRRIRLKSYFDNLKLGHTLDAKTDKDKGDKEHGFEDDVMSVESSEDDQAGPGGFEDDCPNASRSNNSEEGEESDDEDIVFII